MTVCFAVSLFGGTYTVDNLPNVRRQNAMRYVINPDDIISSSVCDSIDLMLHSLESKTGIEMVVAVVESIGDTDCFDFCHNLLNTWGVGKKDKNNGMVVLLVTDQRCIQFYTGYGLEGDMPDALCKRIQTQTMLPYLREADWNNAMLNGMKAVCAVLDGTMSADEVDDDSDEDDGFGIVLAVMLIVFLTGGVAVWVEWKNTRCPNCGKHQLIRSDSLLISRVNGVKTEDVTYTCKNCGRKITRRQESYDDNYRGRGHGGGGTVIFGGGGGFGGGGFSGGSFGGGIGGGGGAGTRF